MIARYRNHLWCAAIVGWCLAATAVWCWATSYEFTTYANSAPVATRWPAGTTLELAAGRPSLLLFLHPRCPCSRATVHELTRVIDHLPDADRPRLTIVATLPPDATPDWRETDTVRNLLKLPHSSVVWDTDGVLANKFGATTSGTVQLYQPDGELLYAGGITPSRGHQGDNAGSDTLTQLLTRETSIATASLPAFGCRLCLGDSANAATAVCDETTGACAIDSTGGTP
ncbi:hypothetical protein [Aeoliella sp. SH292]|uniref:hypothetical protein n=1 Tax=Aeoliella sp. SH292 TaxID=3454464 RepID=UPI003F9874E3